ncbi:unnamed protein product [Calypogeia fissa]
MGLLDKLWDDVVAGPQPEKGLSRLRQRQAGVTEGLESVISMMDDRRRSGENQRSDNDSRRFTQSISIKKPPALQTNFDYSDSPVSSPAASSPMASPATRERENIWRSVFHPGHNNAMRTMGSSPKSPTVYDWVVISALDK